MNLQPITSNPPPQLKVCGLTNLNQIHELIAMEADFLGFIFYEKSPRYVLNHLSLDIISKIEHQGKVGVFVNEKVEKIVEISGEGKLNLIQLHGDESDDFIAELREKLKPEVKIIRVIRIGNHVHDNRKKMLQAFSHLPASHDLQPVSYFLFDTDSKAFGGTGKQFNWALLNEFEIPLPYFLSGGISEENIENMDVLQQKPLALDINSKFEIAPGHKDLNKIKKFRAVVLKRASQ